MPTRTALHRPSHSLRRRPGGLRRSPERDQKSEAVHADVIARDRGHDRGLSSRSRCSGPRRTPRACTRTRTPSTRTRRTHEEGFRTALTLLVNEYARTEPVEGEGRQPHGDDIREGLTAVIRSSWPSPSSRARPRRSSATPRRRLRARVSAPTRRLVRPASHRARGGAQAVQASAARMAAGRARGHARKACWSPAGCRASCATVRSTTRSDPGVRGRGRLRRCLRVRGRDPQTSDPPIRGKILNVERRGWTARWRTTRCRPSHRVRPGIARLRHRQARYHKIILMADADVDGQPHLHAAAHPAVPVLRPLVEAGHVYLAQPPLYG